MIEGFRRFYQRPVGGGLAIGGEAVTPVSVSVSIYHLTVPTNLHAAHEGIEHEDDDLLFCLNTDTKNERERNSTQRRSFRWRGSEERLRYDGDDSGGSLRPQSAPEPRSLPGVPRSCCARNPRFKGSRQATVQVNEFRSFILHRNLERIPINAGLHEFCYAFSLPVCWIWIRRFSASGEAFLFGQICRCGRNSPRLDSHWEF